MDIPINATVECVDGDCGRSAGVIVRPADQHVTQLIVRPQGESERLVPVNKVTETSPDTIHLRCTAAELADMDSFIEREYVTFWRVAFPLAPEPQMISIQHRHVPEGGLSIERGSDVRATDGHVGKVDELIVDPLDKHITHLVLREGHLWNRRDVIIPVGQIDHIEENIIFLRQDKRTVESLPPR